MSERNMDVSARRVAGEVLEVIPLVTRRVAADLRNSERSMKLAYVGLLGTVARNPRSIWVNCRNSMP